MTLKELHEKAKELGIKNVKKYKKAELERLVEATVVSTNDTSERIVPDDLCLLADLESLSPQDLASHLSSLSKSNARKVRKALFNKGFRGLAATRRAA